MLVLVFPTFTLGMSLILVEYINTTLSIIIKLNNKIYDHIKEYKCIKKINFKDKNKYS